MSIFNKINDFFWQMILPQEEIAGIELKDSGIRIAQIRKAPSTSSGSASSTQEFKKESILLEPGIIEDGIIKDKVRLITQLRLLKEQFDPANKEKIPVIAVIPSSEVYVQVFPLPLLGEEAKLEAIKLNLQSISPIDYSSAYADWEQIEEGDNKVQILSAFAGRGIVDSYAEVLMAAGFSPAVVEFPALAMARAIKEFAVGVDFDKPHVVINISSDGIDLVILKNGNIHFDYFAPWKLVKMDGGTAREISFEDFKAVITRELRKISTFYISQWGGSLQNFILVTQAFETEIAQLIEVQFHYTGVSLKLRGFEDVPLSWVAVIGSAFRGTINRGSDIFISLMAIGTENEFLYSQITSFIKLWRNILLVTAVFFVIIFIAADSFFAHTAGDVALQIQNAIKLPNASEVDKLQKDVAIFNSLVDKTAYARERSRVWSPFLIKINQYFGNIGLTRLSLNSEQGTVFLIGKAQNEAAVIDLKNKLIAAGIQNINLPLSKIIDNVDGTVSFSMTFNAQ